MQLTDEQNEIIQAKLAHTVITAVAGSGKTTTLTHRILHLLREGMAPERMLVLMFNRSAKADFERKLASLAGQDFQRLPEIRTYHAMGLRLYRNFIQRGLLPPFQDNLLSEQEIHWQLWRLIQQCAPAALSDDLRTRKTEWVELAASLLDRKKSTLQPLKMVFSEMGIRPELNFLCAVIERFEAWRVSQSRISYADMLHEPVKLIAHNPDIRAWVSDRMDMILVDEYQDTNDVQHLLLTAIAGKRAKVTVVGDPDQTIYEFRGASPTFILTRFSQDFPDPNQRSLTYSFRYGPDVARIANQMIQHNQGRKQQDCRAHPDNPDTEVKLLSSANPITTLIQALRLQKKAGQLNQSAVLFRVWSQSVPVELACLSEGIDYRGDLGKGALANTEVRQIITLLELAANKFPELTPSQRADRLYALMKFPHIGLRDNELQRLASVAAGSDSRFGDHLLDEMPADLHGLQRFKLKRCARLWNQLEKARGNAAKIVRDYVDEAELFRGIQDLALTAEAGQERINIVRQMLTYLDQLKVTPAEAVEHFNRLAERAAQPHEGNTDRLTLSTIHKTKGLEWDHVFILGLSRRYMPYAYQGHTQEDEVQQLESERRLLYVALTRCKISLILLAPKPSDSRKDPDAQPSPFLQEMGLSVTESRKRTKPKPRLKSLFFD